MSTFADFQFIEPIQRALQAEHYETPTPIQVQAIPPLMEGRDLLGCAQTGTGKTAAFALPILHRLDKDRRPALALAPRVLVVCPTRELASQICASFATYGQFLRFRQATVFGGVGQGPQVRALQRGVHILVATPGRLLDLMQQGHVRLDRLDTFVLDEADRMLDMGFLPDVKRIISRLPRERQSIFLSATMPQEVAALADSLLRSPAKVMVTPSASPVEQIEQRVLYVERNNKRDLLHDLVSSADAQRVLVFTRTKRGADNVAGQLTKSGIRTDAIHGGKSQSFRERALLTFRSGRARVLVATDVAARGIDIDAITHVINYDMPHEPESYVHRIGRTGRAGASGTALSLCDASERGSLRAIEKLIGRKIIVLSDHRFHSSSLPPVEPGRAAGPRRPQRSRPAAGRFRSRAR